MAFLRPMLASLWVALWVLSGFPAAQAQPADDIKPVAAWTFNQPTLGLARDVASQTHHAHLLSTPRYEPSPGGKALVFAGPASRVAVADHPTLVMTDSVTVDVWVKIDDLNLPEPQTLVDKGGERYRLQVEPGGGVLFGLKNDTGRFDLTGGRIEAGKWVRLTGVFQRPAARLYIDGVLVKQGTWDQQIGPGADLNLGSKGGVTYFTHGQIDEVRLYREAREPRADDKPVTGTGGAQAGEARMTVTQDQKGLLSIDTGAATFTVTAEGIVSGIFIGGKRVVEGNTEPLLAAQLLETKGWSGWSDLAPGKTIEGIYRPGQLTRKEQEGRLELTADGRLDFGDGDAILTRMVLSFQAGSPFLSATVSLEPQGAFRDRFLRSVAVQMPLALDKRKRIVQGGDRGVRWNTRHWYQFIVDPTGKLMEEPDHNLWRNFVIDQVTDHDYHLWRSESDFTSPLSMQRGLAAPGWIAAYDQRAGLLVGYRDFAFRAPKTLWVEADGPGKATVFLWSPTRPALSPASPEAAAVFGKPHIIDFEPFGDDFRFSQPDLLLREQWGREGLASDEPPRNEIPADGVPQWSEPAADDRAPLVSGGVPFPRGVLTDPGNVRLMKGEALVPLQTRALAYWPDKSIKWLLLTFPPDGGQVSDSSPGDKSLSFELTRRSGPADSYRLEYGGEARPGRAERTLTAEKSGGLVRLDTGPLSVELSTGEEWLRSVKLAGREMLAAGAKSYVDFLRPDKPVSCGRTHTTGQVDPGTFLPESLELEEAGPLRAVVRLEGMTNSVEPQRLILRLEAYAGRSCLRVFQTVEFLHKDPRVAFVRRMGIDVPLVGSAEATVFAGGQEGPVELGRGTPAGLRQHSHLGYRAWRQDTGQRFTQTVESKARSRGWVDVSGPEGGLAVCLREMWQQFPNEISANLPAGTVTLGFWPESIAPMDVRRYSNYPHRSQGESASSPSSWVTDNWYPQDCFVGVSKTHEALLYFHGPAESPTQVGAVMADFQRPPLVYAGRKWYHDTGVVQPEFAMAEEPSLARCDANLYHFAKFWLQHQKLWGWYGLWDYGDVGHYFKGGYGSLFPPDVLRTLLAGGEAAKSIDLTRARFLDYAPNQDWAFDNGRWGWSNTEGLTNLFLQTEYLRTGDRDIFFFLEAMARHFRDVDMRHDGKWFGYGTRHGVQHWSDGNHEERQTTHSEFRYHSYLTGDLRSRDFARQLYERVYSRRDVTIHAAHSGRIQGLLTQWEMTGSDEVADILARYMPTFHVPQGLVESPRVKFPEVLRLAADANINEGNMFFWTFGGGHGMIEYYELTKNEDVRQALIKTADDALASGRIGLRLKAVAFAARHADNPEPYLKAIREWAAGDGRRYLLQIVPHNPEFYAGPQGLLRGSTAGALFTMNDLPYVIGLLSEDPPMDDELRRIDASGGPFYREPVLSWQSEYDLPEFAEYLRIKHPQP
ncbi:MAG: LamG-like jellyroll fold domain-containing protein [Armatimonadia bacterium]